MLQKVYKFVLLGFALTVLSAFTKTHFSQKGLRGFFISLLIWILEYLEQLKALKLGSDKLVSPGRSKFCLQVNCEMRKTMGKKVVKTLIFSCMQRGHKTQVAAI